MLFGAEIATRVFWPEQKINSCAAPDTALGFRYRSNCSSKMKTAEGPWYTNVYNECGYRSDSTCAAAPRGTRRIALIGTSIGEGYLVEYPHTIGASLAADLTSMCGAPVEVQNLAAKGYMDQRLIIRMREALTLRPDAVLLVVLPFDIYEQPIGGKASEVGGAPPKVGKVSGYAGLQKHVANWISESRAIVIAQHFLFRNPAIYLPLYLRFGDKADFMRPPFTSAWEARLRHFESLLGDLADLAQAVHVPMMLAFAPNQAEINAMSSSGSRKEIDPYALPRALESIAIRHGVEFKDTSDALLAVSTPTSLYYQVDGHPSGVGQPIIARAIAHQFVSAVNAFRTCAFDDKQVEALAR